MHVAVEGPPTRRVRVRERVRGVVEEGACPLIGWQACQVIGQRIQVRKGVKMRHRSVECACGSTELIDLRLEKAKEEGSSSIFRSENAPASLPSHASPIASITLRALDGWIDRYRGISIDFSPPVDRYGSESTGPGLTEASEWWHVQPRHVCMSCHDGSFHPISHTSCMHTYIQ
jgi:hypothetical protein